MRLFILIVGGGLLVLLVLGLVLSSIYNVRNGGKPEAKSFSVGQIPNPVLNGDYQGNNFTGLGKNWLGKRFNAGHNSGLNNFKSSKNPHVVEQRYQFTTSIKPGLRNKSLQVLQLDYNIAHNPWWLKPIKDELVQTSPGHYLGKIQLKIGPFVTTLGYFRLEANE